VDNEGPVARSPAARRVAWQRARWLCCSSRHFSRDVVQGNWRSAHWRSRRGRTPALQRRRGQGSCSLLPVWALLLIAETIACGAFAVWLMRTDYLFGHTKGPPEWLAVAVVGALAAVILAFANWVGSLWRNSRNPRSAERSHGSPWLVGLGLVLLLPCAVILRVGVTEVPLAWKLRRIQRVERLPGTGASAVPRLVQALSDPDPLVRWHAADGLADVTNNAPEAKPILVRMARDPGEFANARMAAIRALGVMGGSDRTCQNALVELLAEDTLSAFAEAALRNLGAAAEPALQAGAGHTNFQVRLATAKLLEARGVTNPPTVASRRDDWAETLRFLTQESVSRRIPRMERLGEMGAKAAPAVPALVWVLTNRVCSESERFVAAQTLGAIGPAASNAVPALISIFADGETGTRMVAAEALGNFGAAATAAVPTLVANLKNPLKEIRVSAVEALLSIGTARTNALSEGLELLSDPDAKVRDAAVRWVVAHAKDFKGETRAAAVRALVAKLDDPDPSVIDDAKQHLLDDRYTPDLAGVMPELIRMSGNPRGSTRESAENLMEIYVEHRWRKDFSGPVPPEMVVYFASVLGAPETWRRLSAAHALGMLGPEARSATAALEKAAQDPDNGVGRAAREALGLLNPDRKDRR